jgi:hypothetical protein
MKGPTISRYGLVHAGRARDTLGPRLGSYGSGFLARVMQTIAQGGQKESSFLESGIFVDGLRVDGGADAGHKVD